jgi:hypothetical protein
MKKKVFLTAVFAVVALGAYWTWHSGSSGQTSDLASSSSDQTDSDESSQAAAAAGGEAKTDEAMPDIAREIANLPKKSVGPFETPETRMKAEEVQKRFHNGSVVDGILIQANHKELLEKFTQGKGREFDLPMVDGSSITVIPTEKETNAELGTETFLGKVKGSDANGRGGYDGVSLVFYQGQLKAGEVRANNKRFTIVSDGISTFLLEINSKQAID